MAAVSVLDILINLVIEVDQQHRWNNAQNKEPDPVYVVNGVVRIIPQRCNSNLIIVVKVQIILSEIFDYFSLGSDGTVLM